MSRHVAVLLALIALAAPVAAQNEEVAKVVFEKLKARFELGEREKLRPDLLAFRNKHFGTRAAVEAAALFAQTPGPLDKLDPAKIPVLERFDWQPKELVAFLGEHRCRQGGIVTCVAITPDGKTAMSGGGHLVRFWDPATMREKARVSHTNITALSLSKDGKTLATAGADAHVRIWNLDAEPPKLLHTLPCGTAALYAVALTPNGKTVAAGGVDSLTRVFELPPPKDNKEKVSLGGNTKPVAALTFSPDGKTLVSGGHDESVRGWDIFTNPEQPRELFNLPGHVKIATSLAYAPDGKNLAVGCSDGTVRLWSMATGKPIERTGIPSKGGHVYGLAYHPKLPQLAVASADGKVHFWDVGLTPPRDRGTPAEGHLNYASCAAYFPSGSTVLTGSGDWTVRPWNVPLAGGKPVQKFDLKGHLSHVYTSLFTPDGLTVASGASDRRVRLWSVGQAEPKERSQLKGDDVHVFSLSLAPDGKTLAAGCNGPTVRLYDALAGRELRQLKGHPGAVGGVTFAPDGQRLLAISAKEAFLWNAARGEIIRRWDGQPSRFNSVAWSPNGKYAVTGHGEIEYKNGQPVVISAGVYKYLDPCLRLWDVDEGKEIHAEKTYTRPVGPVTFTADGRTILSGTAQDYHLHQLSVGEEKPRALEPFFKNGDGVVRSVVVSPDGKSVLTLGAGAAATLWDAATGKQLKRWVLQESIGSVNFAADSRHISVTLATGPVYILRLESPPR